MSTLYAKELGFEHLGKTVSVPSITCRTFELIGVWHRVPLSELASLTNPTPTPLLNKAYVEVLFNGVVPTELQPGELVVIHE